MKKYDLLVQKSFGNKKHRPYFCTPNDKRVDLVAQLVEQYTFNVWALGSSPSGITEIKPRKRLFFIGVFQRK